MVKNGLIRPAPFFWPFADDGTGANPPGIAHSVTDRSTGVAGAERTYSRDLAGHQKIYSDAVAAARAQQAKAQAFAWLGVGLAQSSTQSAEPDSPDFEPTLPELPTPPAGLFDTAVADAISTADYVAHESIGCSEFTAQAWHEKADYDVHLNPDGDWFTLCTTGPVDEIIADLRSDTRVEQEPVYDHDGTYPDRYFSTMWVQDELDFGFEPPFALPPTDRVGEGTRVAAGLPAAPELPVSAVDQALATLAEWTHPDLWPDDPDSSLADSDSLPARWNEWIHEFNQARQQKAADAESSEATDSDTASVHPVTIQSIFGQAPTSRTATAAAEQREAMRTTFPPPWGPPSGRYAKRGQAFSP